MKFHRNTVGGEFSYFFVGICLLLHSSAAATSSTVAATAPSNATATITVFKCCRSNEHLDEQAACVPDEGPTDTNWAPVVFSPTKPGLLNPGTIPKNWQFLENRRPLCNQGSGLPVHIPSGPNYVTFDNGSLFLPPGKLFEPNLYCLNRNGALICIGQEEGRRTLERRVQKCCSQGTVYSELKLSCVPLNGSETPHFVAEDTMILTGFPKCPETNTFAITGTLNVDYELNMDGTLRSNNGLLNTKQYCVEKILENRSNDISVFTCGHQFNRSNVNPDDIRFTIYPLVMFLSVFFLAVTLIASCLLPATYHALHWKCQTHYIACLLVGDFLLAVTQISGNSLQGRSICVILATAIHFLFLAAFFWLNTMCFNIWWTFRDLRPTSLDKNQEAWRLKLYELYAWGGPFLIVTVGILMDHVFHHQYPDILRPRFAENKCWFYGNSEILFYFFGPVGILLLINLVLFSATTRELTCGLWKREMVKSTTERTTLSHICLKLVIVMGITWTADILSWIIGGPNYLWYFTDIINGLQGFFIFIVIGCQPQVLSNVKRMWCWGSSHGRGGRSSSSNAMPSIINDQSSTKPVETLC